MTEEEKLLRKREYSRRYEAKRNHAERDRLRNKRPSRRDPIKVKAKDAVHIALGSGRLQRPGACSECSTVGPVQAHHEDYSQPLMVEWLCRPCHSKRHRKYKEPTLVA